MQRWLRDPDLGAVYLTGRDRNIWTDGEDLMSIMERHHMNALSYGIAEYLVPLYWRLVGRHIVSDQALVGGPQCMLIIQAGHASGS